MMAPPSSCSTSTGWTSPARAAAVLCSLRSCSRATLGPSLAANTAYVRAIESKCPWSETMGGRV
eukprot:7385072-Prymnesium_polylepis.1